MGKTLRLYKPNDTHLQELTSRLQDIKGMLQKEFNRKEHFFDKSAKDSIDTVIKFLQKQLDSIEQEINKCISNNQELKQKAKVISSVKCVGQKTTMTLLAALPELGLVNPRLIAALAGLAPYANDSGSCSKLPMTSLGRPIVKRCLFMCALVAIRNSPTLKVFYQRLLSNAKPKMVAIVAIMRKLLIFINNCCKAFYAQCSFINV
ncbi:MAG: transposase [Endomicrobium sp.]|jgi:transposase|nr:transposase [Endomicrobium sp.]